MNSTERSPQRAEWVTHFYEVDGQRVDAATYQQAKAAIDARNTAEGITNDVTCAQCGVTVPIEQAVLWFHVDIPVLPETAAPHNVWFHRLDCLLLYYLYERSRFTTDPLPALAIPANRPGKWGEVLYQLQKRMNLQRVGNR